MCNNAVELDVFHCLRHITEPQTIDSAERNGVMMFRMFAVSVFIVLNQNNTWF